MLHIDSITTHVGTGLSLYHDQNGLDQDTCGFDHDICELDHDTHDSIMTNMDRFH